MADFLIHFADLWWKFLICIFLFGLVAVGFSGFSGKKYASLSPDEVLKIGGESMSIKNAAELFKPTICIDDQFDAVDSIWYDAISRNGQLVITYFPSWENERYPHTVLHIIYMAWRWLYYGSFRDIEFISLKIDLFTGRVNSVHYQNPLIKKFDVVEHEDTFFVPSTAELDSSIVLRPENCAGFYLSVVSWNHLFAIGKIGDKFHECRNEISYLTNETFCRFKFNRRSKPVWLRQQSQE